MPYQMTDRRIAQLLQPFLVNAGLWDQQIGAIQTYLDLLLKWNAKLNLTAIRDPEEIVTRHFGESLFAARQLIPQRTENQTVIDVGSGAGFPGLPIKIWAPSVKLTLIESNRRKSTFLRELTRALGMQDVEVVTARAESLSIRADLVMFRAVEHFEETLRIASALAHPGGRLAILIGAQQVAKTRAVLPGIGWSDPSPIPNSNNRVVLVGQCLSVAIFGRRDY
jgi:16S rRNA (guanine527-N7)-methyltransferase